ncbi:MAG: hypothetical protein WCA46_05340, partial [Actinocatenispora sp.]
MRFRAWPVLSAVAIGGLVIGLAVTATSPIDLGPLSSSSTQEPRRSAPPRSEAVPNACTVNARLVPSCGALWGVAPAAHTNDPLPTAVRSFERKTGRTQTVFHTYHRGITQVFPTPTEKRLSRQPRYRRVPFINWKPQVASWAAIARGVPKVDAFIDRLARHIKRTFPDRFFLTIHHEPENDVVQRSGSGMTASDYADMYRHVVQRLRKDGVHNAVFVMTYMGYVKWCVKPWHDDLYPGDDVVDWVAWDTYAYSTPGYGYGDFAEMMNRDRIPGTMMGNGLVSGTLLGGGLLGGGLLADDMMPAMTNAVIWPGFYRWASREFPDKPLMLGEWGVWAGLDTSHKAWFYRNVADEISNFPRIKAMVYFDSPNAEGRDSRVDRPNSALSAYRYLGSRNVFQVALPAPATLPKKHHQPKNKNKHQHQHKHRTAGATATDDTDPSPGATVGPDASPSAGAAVGYPAASAAPVNPAAPGTSMAPATSVAPGLSATPGAVPYGPGATATPEPGVTGAPSGTSASSAPPAPDAAA